MTGAILDDWSPLAFIQSLGGEDGKAPPHAPPYFPLSDQRRLRAYNILTAFMTNTRRDFLPAESHSGLDYDEGGRPRNKSPEAHDYREYGDASLVVEALRDLILGDSQDVTVTADPESAVAVWVDDWIRSERFEVKLLEAERSACGLGDAVFVLGVSERAKRPKLRVEDPGFYFPDTQTAIEGWDDADFPPIVHLVWEYEDEDRHTWVRRTTWRMKRLPAPVSTKWGSTREWTCMYSVSEWKRGDIHGKATVYSDEMGRNGRVVTPPQDLRIDFIPVIHVPNTPEEWGRSILTLVAQLLDDLQSTDSDLAIGSQTANPLLVTEGSSLPILTGMPGESLGLPAGGKASYISASLAGQVAYLDNLMRRLAQNTRLGEVLLGRTSPADVPSGYAMELGFHPARQVMRNARRVRFEKYPLIIKFATRMAQEYGWLEAGKTPDIEVALGASLPGDKDSATKNVTALLNAHAISTKTAVAMLVEAGLPIEDAQDELSLILAENTKALVEIIDAAGGQGVAYVIDRLTDLTNAAKPEADNTGQ